MKPLQWQQVRELFASTRQLPKEEHDEHLATSCNDPIVIEQVQKLLKHDREDDFLDSPALGDTFTLADTEEPVSGMQVPENLIDGYKLTGILGSGASGIVYEADQFNPKRTVAIKVLRAGAMGREEQLRFHREAETLASLNHPNIATIFAVGTTEDGSPWMAMELAKGERLDAWAEQATVQELTELFTTICDAIEVPHNNAIIHRDLKPANIVVTEHNNPKVLDFGVARVLQEQEAMTQTGAVIGTRSYMSPEQASGSFQVDARSDVFALGLMLDEFLPVNAPRDLRTIAMKAHDEFADRRYNSAGALHQDLVRFQQGKPVHARRAGVFYLANLWVKRHKAITSLFVLLMIASVFTYLQMHKVTKGEREKKQLSYSASIQEAQLYRDKGDLTSMKSALLETPEELRGWEWDWLHEQLSIGTLSTSAVAASAFSQTNILTVNPDHEVLHLIEGHSILPRDVTCKQSLISRDCSTILRLHDDHSISLTTAGELQPTHVIQLNTQWQNVAAIQLSDDGHFALLAVSVSFNPDDLSTLNAPSRLILIDCVEAKVVLNEQLNERVLDSNEAIAINGNATVIAAATVRGNVTVWKRDSTTIIDRRQFKVGQGSSLVALDTTGRLLAIAFLGTATSNVRLLTMDTLKTDENLPIIAHDHAITSIDISPKNTAIASIDTGGLLRITPLDGGSSIAESVQEGDQGASLQFSYDGKWVLIRDEKNTVSMHPTVSSESELQLTNEPFSTVHFASNRLTLKSHETVHVYDHDTQTVLTQKADDAIVAPDLKLNSQPEDFILEIASRVGRDASELRMSTIAASQKFVAFGLPNGEILLWNKDTELLVPIPRTLPKGVDALCLSNDEKRLVAASVGTIVLFDTNSGIAVLTLKWKFAFIRFLGWFDEGKTLVAISMDGRIRTWAVQGSD